MTTKYTRTQLEEWRKEEKIRKEQCRKSLEAKYAQKWGPDTKAVAWRYAWEEGHSAGFGEVEMYYEDIADLINTVIRESEGG